MSDRIIIELTPAEVEQAKIDGKKMYDHKAGNGYLVKAVDGRVHPIWNDIIGIAGEIAVHKWLHVPWNFELHEIRDAGDIVVGDWVIDVKTHKWYKNEWLNIQQSHVANPKKAHINTFLLVNHIYKMQKFEVIGYARRPDDFTQPPWEYHKYSQFPDAPVYRIHKLRLERAEYLPSLLRL